tara:strand:- start:713 stop:1183 length:471 start_codon:yes stop_codon:yes gene_type:complete
MGYTHYWTINQKEISPESWYGFIQEFETIQQQFQHKLDHNGDEYALCNEYIRFNGIGEQGHETFTMNRINPMEKSHTGDIEYFDFCKTAEKEYDIAVCCALIIAKNHFGNIIKVTSDGGFLEWKEANTLCKDILKYKKNFDIDHESDNGDYGGEFT